MFWPLQSNSKVSGVPENSQVPISGVWVSSSHSLKVGLREKWCTTTNDFLQLKWACNPWSHTTPNLPWMFLASIFFLMWVLTSKMVCDSFVSKINSPLGVFLTYFLCNFYCIKCCPSCLHICMFKDRMFFNDVVPQSLLEVTTPFLFLWCYLN